ncbi:MAG: bacteriohemerythrin [Magnetococcales bacterium]|nr:bacteriohemerythrin [Magnetococcales bacterium]
MNKIIKIKVSVGIYWIEVAEAGLRILCGCPGDSIKHLIKRGLVVPQEKQGVAYESGPNAILLSDTMVQNGDFANLAEFPVLHMLYKQGMIIPKHPNNTGVKPLLIGQSEQVNAQMQYIYRGNYGLVSKEEVMETGMDAHTASEMMRMKLHFAYGKISSSNAFLDTIQVGSEKVGIRNGVFIQRTATNIFEISYEGERVTVDLNLKPGERYVSPYPLGFQKLKREYFAVIHSGEGDGWDINRPSMASIISFQGKIFLIDCGPNLFYNLTALGIGLEEIEGIFQTHAHDDHCAGITTLMRAGHKIKFFATPVVRATVQKKLAALLSMEEENFQDYFAIHDLTFDVWNDVDGLEVKPVFSPHPLETSIFMFRTLWAGGYKTYAHFADIVAFQVLQRMVTDDAAKPGVTQAFFDHIREAYLQPANLKKLDIGGGAIHGMADDFRDDRSDKLLLSHTSQELTLAEKKIGSSAPYGVTDVLIPAESDYSRRSAFAYLQSYLPNAPVHHIRILLNCSLRSFNPGEIILKEGVVPDHLLLVLSGMVESIHANDDISGQLFAGTLIGEIAGIQRVPSDATYRSSSFMHALVIPAGLYHELIKKNNLAAKIEKNWRIRIFLQSTRLFGEGVSHPVFSRICDALHHHYYQIGDIISCRDLGSLNIVKSGQFVRLVGQEALDCLGVRDFFGEEGAVFDIPCLFRVQATQPSETLQIPGELLKEIPIVRWKLFESYLKRTQKIVYSGSTLGVLSWREEFGINNAQMDVHHKKLVEIANSIIEILRSTQDRHSLERAFEGLVDYTKYHFAAEENLMRQYHYPDLERHQRIHHVLVAQVMDYREKMTKLDSLGGVVFEKFFFDWIVGHILNEDRKYSIFLNDQCVF